MTLVSTAIGRLYVEERGAGPPVVMWPSLFCDGRSLAAQVEELAADHRVIVIDGPGHGRSEAPRRRFRLEATAQALGKLMDDLGAPRAVLLGNAWGGMVATQLAATEPERVAALVLMNCPFHEWAGAKRLKLRMGHWLLWAFGPKRIAPMIFSSMVTPAFRSAEPARYRQLLDWMGAAEKRGFAVAAASAMFDRPELGPLLPGLRAPTLVIAGDSDPIYPLEEARAEAALIPGARFEVVPGTAHVSGWEAPAAVNRLVRSFVQSLAARPAA